MAENRISRLMKKDHHRLLNELKELESLHDRDIAVINEAFRNFKWNIEKHFFVEERAIFTSYNPKKINEGYNLFKDLTDQHTEILEQIEKIQQKLQKFEPFDYDDLKKILVDHKNIEEEKIYPALDEEINEGEKRFIIERMKDIKIHENAKSNE